MKLSVIVPTYNHEPYIGDLLDELVAQRCSFDWEVLVADDVSQDATRDIVSHYADKHSLIKPIFQPENLGGLGNTLSLIGHSIGDYICRVDGDDGVFPDKFQRMVDFLDAHPEAAMVAHSVQMIDQDSKPMRVMFSEAASIDTPAHFLSRGWVFPGAMFRRSCLPKEGLFSDPSVHAQDTIWQAQYCQSGGKVGFISEVLGKYRTHSENFTNQRRNEDINKSFKSFLIACDLLVDSGQMSNAEFAACIKGRIRGFTMEHFRKRSEIPPIHDMLQLGMARLPLDVEAKFNPKTWEVQFTFKL